MLNDDSRKHINDTLSLGQAFDQQQRSGAAYVQNHAAFRASQATMPDLTLSAPTLPVRTLPKSIHELNRDPQLPYRSDAAALLHHGASSLGTYQTSLPRASAGVYRGGSPLGQPDAVLEMPRPLSTQERADLQGMIPSKEIREAVSERRLNLKHCKLEASWLRW